MKAVLLHGLGQTARDWRAVMDRIPALEMECPELTSLAEDGAVYSDLLASLERRCGELPAPFCLCGLSLGAMLALDYAVRHGERVASLILIGAQVRVPTRLVDFQNLVFRCMPKRAFAFVKFAIPFGPPLARLDRKKNRAISTTPPMIYGAAARYHGSETGR